MKYGRHGTPDNFQGKLSLHAVRLTEDTKSFLRKAESLPPCCLPYQADKGVAIGNLEHNVSQILEEKKHVCWKTSAWMKKKEAEAVTGNAARKLTSVDLISKRQKTKPAPKWRSFFFKTVGWANTQSIQNNRSHKRERRLPLLERKPPRIGTLELWSNSNILLFCWGVSLWRTLFSGYSSCVSI